MGFAVVKDMKLADVSHAVTKLAREANNAKDMFNVMFFIGIGIR